MGQCVKRDTGRMESMLTPILKKEKQSEKKKNVQENNIKKYADQRFTAFEKVSQCDERICQKKNMPKKQLKQKQRHLF